MNGVLTGIWLPCACALHTHTHAWDTPERDSQHAKLACDAAGVARLRAAGEKLQGVLFARMQREGVVWNGFAHFNLPGAGNAAQGNSAEEHHVLSRYVSYTKALCSRIKPSSESRGAGALLHAAWHLRSSALTNT